MNVYQCFVFLGGGLAALELYKTEVNKSIKTSKAVVEKYENLCSEKGVSNKP